MLAIVCALAWLPSAIGEPSPAALWTRADAFVRGALPSALRGGGAAVHSIECTARAASDADLARCFDRAIRAHAHHDCRVSPLHAHAPVCVYEHPAGVHVGFVFAPVRQASMGPAWPHDVWGGWAAGLTADSPWQPKSARHASLALRPCSHSTSRQTTLETSVLQEDAYASARFNATLFPPDASTNHTCAAWPRCTTAPGEERRCQRRALARRLAFSRRGSDGTPGASSCWHADWRSAFRRRLRYARLLAERLATIGADPPIVSDRLYAEALFTYEPTDIAAIFYLNRTGMPRTLGMPPPRDSQRCARPLDSAHDARRALRLALELERGLTAVLSASRAQGVPMRRLPVLQFANGVECHNGSAAAQRIDSGSIRPIDGTGFAPPPLDELRSAAAASALGNTSTSLPLGRALVLEMAERPSSA